MVEKKKGRPKKITEPILGPQLEARKFELNRCYRDLEYFGRKISPNTYYLKSPEFHKEMASLLMDRNLPQVLLEAPRGTSKSSLAVSTVMHHATFDEGDKVIVIQSKTRKEAINRLNKIKEILSYSQGFISLFGYAGEQVASVWREDKIKTRIGGFNVSISALGTGQQVRGILEGDTRITLYLLDDADDEDNTKSKETMDDNFSKFLGGLAGLDRRNGRCIVIGTPITDGCIVARLRGATGWETRVYEARTPDDDTGVLLWEEMYNHAWLNSKKQELEEQGMLWKYYSEYLCQLKGKDDQVFKEEDFRYWDGEFVLGEGTEHYIRIRGIYDHKKQPIGLYDEPILTPVLTFLGVDPSFSLNPKADYSVSMPIAVSGGWDIYQLPYIRKRMLLNELVESISYHNKIYRPSRTTIESGAQQDSVRQAVRLLENDYIVGLGKKVPAPKDSKHKRYVDILQYYHVTHKLFLHISQSNELKQEMIMHPSMGSHDDTIDALYWSVKRAYTPDHESKKAEEDDLRYFLRNSNKTKNWLVA